jgi:hypothetical protein
MFILIVIWSCTYFVASGVCWRFTLKPILMFFPILTEIFSELQVASPVPVTTRSAAARLLRLWFRIPPGTWMFVCGECCVLSGRGLCDELITRPEESYRLWCVTVCDLETSIIRRPWHTGRCRPRNKKTSDTSYHVFSTFYQYFN